MNHRIANPAAPAPHAAPDKKAEKAEKAEKAADRRVLILIVCVVAAQAWVLLFHLGHARAPILGSDGPGYHRLAVNLLHHACFSFSEKPPYEATAFRTPGYPLFLAAVYGLSGGSFLALRLVQFALFATTAWLLYRVGTRFVGRGAAAIGALLCIVCWPMAFLPVYHLTETISAFLAVLFVFLLTDYLQTDYLQAESNATAAPKATNAKPTMESRRTQLAFAMGLALGVAALIRPSLALLVVVPLVLLALPRTRLTGRTRARGFALVCAGFALCVGPWLARNLIVAHKPIPFAVSSGISLSVSAQQYDNRMSYAMRLAGDWVPLVALQDRRRAAARRELQRNGTLPGTPPGISPTIRCEMVVDRQFAQDAAQTMRGLSAWQIIASLPVRAAYFWSWNSNDDAPWAPGNRAQHALVVGLLLSGCWTCRRSLLRHWPLWVVPLYLTLVHFVFHVESRYSYPARPFLMLYMSVPLAQAAAWMVARLRPRLHPLLQRLRSAPAR